MFGRRRSRFSRAASLPRKRGRRNAGKAPGFAPGKAPGFAPGKATPEDKARFALAAAQQKTAASAPKATSTPPTGVMTVAREGRQAGIKGKPMRYTERWAKARGKK